MAAMTSAVDRSIVSSHIVIVDDQLINVRLVEQTLRHAGFQSITSTCDAREVAKICRDCRADLVLLDLHMPGMDGFEAIARIHDLGLDRPPYILMVTADTAAETQTRLLKCGVADVMTKPFNRVEIVNRVSQLLKLRLVDTTTRAAFAASVHPDGVTPIDARSRMASRMLSAIDQMDDAGVSHLIRVSHGAALLGRATGLSVLECDLLLRAAPLHDVGKVTVPRHILGKTGALTDEELQLVRSHTTTGASMLQGSDSPMLRMAQHIARSHHERWDGDGYPDGLKSVAIPLPARIVAICDVFDILTVDRPMRAALATEQAVAIMQDERGGYFDPELLDAFLATLPDALQIQQQFPEPVCAVTR